MKIANWCKNVRVALLAAGFWVPCTAYAVDIPLGDPSFEAWALPERGYDYANAYRPTSAWVDDLNDAGGTQDDAASNWLYNAAYAELTTFAQRAAPRTGNQAMHGFGHYSAQVTSGVFEAGKTYTFSIWAQGDDDATLDTSRVWLYLFNGGSAFSEPTSLTFRRYAPDTGNFINRPSANPAESQAAWRQINIKHTVLQGAPEIGSPVGVAFWGASDAAVDDAALSVDPAENVVLYLEVNTSTGQVQLKNQTGASVPLDYYEITSAAGSLKTSAWSSLQDQNLPGLPAGNGSGNGWEEAGGSSANTLSESFLTGASSLASGSSINLGAAFNSAGAQDLQFRYSILQTAAPASDFDSDGDADGADFLAWQKNVGLAAGATKAQGNADGDGDVDAQDLAIWKSQLGGGSFISQNALQLGYVRYVASAAAVPESSTLVLAGMGALIVGACRAGRSGRG